MERLEKGGVVSPPTGGQERPEATKTKTVPTAGAGAFPWWDNLLTELRRKKRTVEALPKEGTPPTYRSGRLVVEFSPDFRFHWESVKRTENLRLVEEVLQQITGKQITLEYVLEKTKKEDPAQQPDLVQKALDLFGGRVVESEEEE